MVSWGAYVFQGRRQGRLVLTSPSLSLIWRGGRVSRHPEQQQERKHRRRLIIAQSYIRPNTVSQYDSKSSPRRRAVKRGDSGSTPTPSIYGGRSWKPRQQRPDVGFYQPRRIKALTARFSSGAALTPALPLSAAAPVS